MRPFCPQIDGERAAWRCQVTEMVRDSLRERCACVRQGELVTPYKLQRFSVGCDKFALANAGTPIESPFDSNHMLFEDCSST
jgi:hypothetical protein